MFSLEVDLVFTRNSAVKNINLSPTIPVIVLDNFHVIETGCEVRWRRSYEIPAR